MSETSRFHALAPFQPSTPADIDAIERRARDERFDIQPGFRRDILFLARALRESQAALRALADDLDAAIDARTMTSDAIFMVQDALGAARALLAPSDQPEVRDRESVSRETAP